MPQVTFLPSGRTIEVADDQSLLSAALDAGIAIATACGGVANCTECKLCVEEGQEHLSPMEYPEGSKLGNVFYITRERLACQTRALGPLTVRVLKEELGDKRERARVRALRRAQENLARRAAKNDDDVRRRLALLNDDGAGGEGTHRLHGGRGAGPPPTPAGPPPETRDRGFRPDRSARVDRPERTPEDRAPDDRPPTREPREGAATGGDDAGPEGAPRRPRRRRHPGPRREGGVGGPD